MSLVSSNNPNLVADTVREALGVYRDGGNVAAALQVLTRLKGIGPATASLLLAVHDPTRVIFFSDEAFYWLCRSGRKAPIKYNAKEYQELRTKAQELAERLDVSATDLEKVAYVLMKQPDNMAEASMNASAKTTPTPAKGASATKRKAARELESAPKEPPVRRSKRSKAC
ncbi:hypothetical protein ACRE_037060 [Hapsidospora chrysogenum ATCC 11550]|uniref:Uncharacterized protein n=1 Tax=Hapsidospora chrysogenum (strain ATCC 11550 / CBS 779.69 / DSM 880 / IAM 14645 / JCM 23072 / IMI 49137) TaxID=857340 RepID=A0A086T7Z5_HAPC1|nr:hypothetical protein ACRE_037060 [Hapsidospora chrysogenum ATCC 11550]